MDIKYGTLLNVYGACASHAGFTFMPADVQLDGTSFSVGFRPSEQPPDQLPLILRQAVRERIDAAWVRARIPSVFHFTPAVAEAEKALLEVGFVAVTGEPATGYAFVCTDHYGRTGLVFSDDGPNQNIKESIAAAFWELLSANPDDVTDFDERVYHPGAGVWLNYGCESGRLYCDEVNE